MNSILPMGSSRRAADTSVRVTIGDGNAWPGTNYNVLMAFDFSGTIEQDEYDRCQSMAGIGALDPGAISNPDFDAGPWSCAGYDGSIYDDIADLSCVRFRWYDAGLGRWMTRDPAGHVDGSAVFQYVSSSAHNRTDPFGLRSIELSFNAFIPGRLGVWLPEPFTRSGYFQTDLRGFGEFDHDTAWSGAPSNARLYHISQIESTDVGREGRDVVTRIQTGNSHQTQVNEQAVLTRRSPLTTAVAYEGDDRAFCSTMLSVRMSAAYPFIPMAPPIDIDVKWTLYPIGRHAIAVLMDARHEPFPSYEGYVDRVLTYVYDTAGTGPFPHLIGGARTPGRAFTVITAEVSQDCDECALRANYDSFVRGHPMFVPLQTLLGELSDG